MNIETKRMLIVPLTNAVIDRILQGDDLNPQQDGIRLLLKDAQSFNIYPVLPYFKRMNSKINHPLAFLFIDLVNLEVIGNGGFKGELNNLGELEIGYELLPRFQGKGYALEAVNVLCKYGFSIGAKTILAETSSDNIRSIHLLKKIRFTKKYENKEQIVWRLEEGEWNER